MTRDQVSGRRADGRDRPRWRLCGATLLAGMAAAHLAGCGPRPTTLQETPPAVAQTQAPVTARDFYELGRAYETGADVPVDLNRAVELFQEAYRRGEPRASERLGLLAARGDIVLDDARTYDRLLVASLRQSDSAALELARLQVTGAQGVPRNLLGAIASLEELAADHDPGAMIDLAQIYAQPELGHLDYQRARSLLMDAHARGRPEASLALARLYARPGTGLTSRAEARSWAEIAVGRGLADGWVVIGSLTADPAAAGFDPAAAEAAYQRAIDSGVPGARLELAKLQEATGRTEAAFATYRQLIAEGQVELGYEAGRILDETEPSRRGEAYAYYESAHAAGREAVPRRLLNLLEDDVPDPDGDRGPAIAIVTAWADALGDPVVHYRLARSFEDGTGDMRDRQQALRYFVMAADGGEAEGALRAARILRQAGGSEQAVAGYYRRAASLGERDALVELARWQEETGQLGAAAETLAAAANAGQGDAAVHLARLTGDNPDLVDSRSTLETLERAATGGSPEAMLALGDALVTAGGDENRARALDLYRQSADQGNTAAMRRLGDLAEEGAGGMTAEDARVLFEQALAAGDGRAAYRVLRNAARHGSGQADYQRALDLATPAAMAGQDPLVAYWYGVVLIELDRQEEAVEYLLAAHGQAVPGALEELTSLAEESPRFAQLVQQRVQQASLTGDACDVGRYALVQADQGSSQGTDAATLYQEALQAGWYAAADRLGGLYMTGLGSGSPDLPRAYAYFQIASGAGIPSATERASDLSLALDEDQLAAATSLRAELEQGLPAACAE